MKAPDAALAARSHGRPTLAVVVPMYNEEAGAEKCVTAVLGVLPALGRPSRLIVVEDGSRDRTREVLQILRRQGADFTLVLHDGNRGYGVSLRTGAAEARRQGYDYVLFMDSDLTNPPDHIARFLPAMDRGVDVIKGCRYGAQGKVEGVPWWRYLISWSGNLLVQYLFAVGVRDATNGFRCIKTDVFLSLPVADPRFSSIMEELYWSKRLGCSFANVATTLHTRSAERRQTSFSYKPSTFYKYLRWGIRSWFLPYPPHGAWPQSTRPSSKTRRHDAA